MWVYPEHDSLPGAWSTDKKRIKLQDGQFFMHCIELKTFQVTTCERQEPLDVTNGGRSVLPFQLFVKGYDESQSSLTDMYIHMVLGFASEEELKIREAEINQHIR